MFIKDYYFVQEKKIMGLLSQIFNALTDGDIPQEKDKRINEKLFIDEAKAYGLTKEEIEEFKKSGITPEEWVQDKNK